MVDSSVGGKTAINLPEGKNLVGVFHQPIEVTADLTSLKTLHDREYLSGLAEVVKYGVIWDPGLFRKLEQNAGKLVERDMDLLEEVITRCCEIKAEVVAIDEKEAGIRAVLNFGHTFGHALEKVSGYGRWLHGEAVAVGMVYEGRVSVGEKGFPEDEFERLRSLLCELKLPVSLGDRLSGRGAWKRIRDAMRSDKKTKASVPRFVLAERLGSVVFGCEVDEKTLEQSFAAVAAE
jgi:3-dehydroquinate synthase